MSIVKSRARLLIAGAAAVLSIVALRVGEAGPLSLVDVPLFLGSSVEPNLIMAIDDSSSMDGELLLPTNDGAAWWRTANASGGCSASSGTSFTGCKANGTADVAEAGTLNFNNAGEPSGTWKKYVYLFPNGANSADSSDQRRLTDSTNDHFAVPPLPAFAW